MVDTVLVRVPCEPVSTLFSLSSPRFVPVPGPVSFPSSSMGEGATRLLSICISIWYSLRGQYVLPLYGLSIWPHIYTSRLPFRGRLVLFLFPSR